MGMVPNITLSSILPQLLVFPTLYLHTLFDVLSLFSITHTMSIFPYLPVPSIFCNPYIIFCCSVPSVSYIFNIPIILPIIPVFLTFTLLNELSISYVFQMITLLHVFHVYLSSTQSLYSFYIL